ncbi:MAG: hypothetical protein GY797_32855 [Deltaproteobacteria bacterium]|nr:hypothetical protein [Deltaproteobacteria bacterium]
MSVKVQFEMYVDNDQCLSEDVIMTNIDIYRSGIIQMSNSIGSIEGSIVISSSNIPNKSIKIEDNLGALTQRLCYEGVRKLIVQQSVEITFFTYYAKLTLEPKDEFITVSGDYVPDDIKFTRSTLLPALFYCGKRYLKVLRLLAKYESHYPKRLIEIEELAKVTEQDLRNAKIIL